MEGFALAALVAAFIGAFCLWANLKRPHLDLQTDLVPNQLLTTYPVVFLTGKRSLFYFLNYWNSLPQRLRDHGYEVLEWNLPWRSRRQIQKRLRELIREFENSGRHFHIIADATMEEHLLYLAEQKIFHIQSLNLVGEDENELLDSFSGSLSPRIHPIRFHALKTLNAPRFHWTQFWVKVHQCLIRPFKFHPFLIGITSDQKRLEEFYLKILTELAVLDLRS